MTKLVEEKEKVKINFQEGEGYVCLAIPNSLRKILDSKILKDEQQRSKLFAQHINDNGSIVMEILSITYPKLHTVIGEDSTYKVGDHVMVDVESLSRKRIMKPKSSWVKEDVPEFDEFMLGYINGIEGKKIYVD